MQYDDNSLHTTLIERKFRLNSRIPTTLSILLTCYPALALCEFILGVKPSLYAKYYFELRSLYSDIRSAAPYTGANEWTQKPLSIIKARRLEDRSIKVWEKKAKKSSRAITPILSTPVIESELKTNESSFVGSSSTTCSPRRGWQTTNLFHAQAHARTLFMGMYEDSKEKNFNPYVNDSRPRSGLRSPCVEDLHTDNLSLLSTNRSPATSITQSSVNTSGWVFAGTQRGEELVVRTYEDITLTDTSRFVIS